MWGVSILRLTLNQKWLKVEPFPYLTGLFLYLLPINDLIAINSSMYYWHSNQLHCNSFSWIKRTFLSSNYLVTDIVGSLLWKVPEKNYTTHEYLILHVNWWFTHKKTHIYWSDYSVSPTSTLLQHFFVGISILQHNAFDSIRHTQKNRINLSVQLFAFQILFTLSIVSLVYTQKKSAYKASYYVVQ